MFTAGTFTLALLLQVTRIAMRYSKSITVNDDRIHLFLYTPLESHCLSANQNANPTPYPHVYILSEFYRQIFYNIYQYSL